MRTEHPNPQFKRENWVNLNGEWDFGFEKAKPRFTFSADESRAAEIHAKKIYTHKINVPFCVESVLSEWAEALNRDFNHPSIIGWCPFNETWDYKGRRQYDALLAAVYDYTKAVDLTRPCIDTSGNFHVKTDIYDVHDYSYDVELFRKNYAKLVTDGELYEYVLVDNPDRQKYAGQPTFVSEYGGIKWETDKNFRSWGYGEDVKTEEEFAERYCGLTNALSENEKMFGFCYTQLYDIEQEQNGLFNYKREKKFSDAVYEKIRNANARKAAIEEK